MTLRFAMSEILIESVEDVRSPLFRASYALYRRVFPRDEQMPKRYFSSISWNRLSA